MAESPGAQTPPTRAIIPYMGKRNILISILAILFGVFMVVYGGYDDSPGGQLLGVVVSIIGITAIVRGRKNV